MGSNGTRAPPLPALKAAASYLWPIASFSFRYGRERRPAKLYPKSCFRRDTASCVSTYSLLICVHHNPAAAGFRSTLKRGHALGVPITASITARRPCTHCRFLVSGFDQLDVETERLQLADEHVKRFRHARLHGSFAFDDGLVNLGAAINVVGLRRQQFLKNERRAIRFERPNFHFSEALSTELRLTTQRLLSDQRVR